MLLSGALISAIIGMPCKSARTRSFDDALFVNSGRIWTSAGVSAGIDMALAMIENDLGHLTALNVARSMVLFLKRPGGQSQFSVELRQQIQDARGRFEDLHDWIRNNLTSDLSVPALAEMARMARAILPVSISVKLAKALPE